ncbi:MAG: glucokinase [Pseudomonadota bacterium]
MRMLVGDIGGTHCRLALAHIHEGRVDLTQARRYVNADFTSLAQIIHAYLDSTPGSTANLACLAVAGPTDGRNVQFTNLDWHIDTRALQADLPLARISLINDFVAVGWGLNALQAQDVHLLQGGTANPKAPKAAVGAGTGLGVSIAVAQGALHVPMATEGGHISFAPADPEQDRLLAFMRRIHGRVSVERLVSGPGIEDLYQFCAADAGQTPPGPVSAPAISQAALVQTDPVARKALTLFARLYGQVAGDIALVANAQAGIYLAGGIAPQILPILNGPAFLEGFHAKGRFSDWMHTVPVAVILDPDIGLRGAAIAGNA